MLIVKREEERTTRERILFMLKQQGTLTAREMTADLGLTGMAIRRHLTALEQDGWIEVREARATAGRPSSVYQLTVRGDSFFQNPIRPLHWNFLKNCLTLPVAVWWMHCSRVAGTNCFVADCHRWKARIWPDGWRNSRESRMPTDIWRMRPEKTMELTSLRK